MMDDARRLPQELPEEILEGSPYACFVLTESLDIAYCNAAWDRFALQNGGADRVLAAQIVSRNLLDFIAPELKDYHAGLFAQARSLGRAVSHDYECSSPSVFRQFRMQIYPLLAGRGFTVINSLTVERPHNRLVWEPSEAVYRNSNGLIRMCANCRRTNRAGHPDIWDWVPAYLERTRRDVTHGLCPVCAEYYYHDVLHPDAGNATSKI
jgi:hypothetical protein